MPGGAQGQRLLQDGDPEGVRAPGEDGAGGRHQAVPVAVGLHHGHQGAADALAQHRGVGGDGVEIDDHLGAGGSVGHVPECSRRRAGTPRTRLTPSGSRRTRSPARSGPRSAASCPARPCRWAATAPASAAGSPAASSAPAIPDSTSPVPAVASHGVPVPLTKAVPSAIGDDRGVALEQDGAAQVGGEPAGRADAVGTVRGSPRTARTRGRAG